MATGPALPPRKPPAAARPVKPRTSPARTRDRGRHPRTDPPGSVHPRRHPARRRARGRSRGRVRGRRRCGQPGRPRPGGADRGDARPGGRAHRHRRRPGARASSRTRLRRAARGAPRGRRPAGAPRRVVPGGPPPGRAARRPPRRPRRGRPGRRDARPADPPSVGGRRCPSRSGRSSSIACGSRRPLLRGHAWWRRSALSAGPTGCSPGSRWIATSRPKRGRPRSPRSATVPALTRWGTTCSPCSPRGTTPPATPPASPSSTGSCGTPPWRGSRTTRCASPRSISAAASTGSSPTPARATRAGSPRSSCSSATPWQPTRGSPR